MREIVCSFFGHREIRETEALKSQVRAIIEELIEKENVNTFLFGSKSRFNDLCYELVTEAKEKHPHIKRIYVRGEYPFISERYKRYLLKDYEDTYFPEKAIRAGRASYILRNEEMIRQSDFCVFYYNEREAPAKRKSGTKNALNFARRRNKKIILTDTGAPEKALLKRDHAE